MQEGKLRLRGLSDLPNSHPAKRQSDYTTLSKCSVFTEHLICARGIVGGAGPGLEEDYIKWMAPGPCSPTEEPSSSLSAFSPTPHPRTAPALGPATASTSGCRGTGTAASPSSRLWVGGAQLGPCFVLGKRYLIPGIEGHPIPPPGSPTPNSRGIMGLFSPPHILMN